jgi:hypothetical protein
MHINNFFLILDVILVILESFKVFYSILVLLRAYHIPMEFLYITLIFYGFPPSVPLALTFAVVYGIVVATLVTASFLKGFIMEGYMNKLGFTFNAESNLGA